jgi:hypothetical protein
MKLERCGVCDACKHIEAVKPTVLRCANPPFSHVDDGPVRLWNQELFDHPCEKWSDDEKLATQAQMLVISESVRPNPNRCKLRLVLDVEYTPNGVSKQWLKNNLTEMVKHAAGEGLFTGESAAETETWSHRIEEVDAVAEEAMAGAVAMARVLGVGESDLDDLVHDMASSPASEINNQGVDDQVRFLCQQMGTKDVLARLREIKKGESA